jgi:hypothetical protein
MHQLTQPAADRHASGCRTPRSSARRSACSRLAEPPPCRARRAAHAPRCPLGPAATRQLETQTTHAQ